MKTEEEITELAEQFVKNHKDFPTEGFSEYQNGLFNGYVEGYKAAVQNIFDKVYAEGHGAGNITRDEYRCRILNHIVL